MKLKSLSISTFALLTLFLVCLPLRGDIIHLKNGRKFEGQIVKETENELRLRIYEGIFLTLKKEEVEKIEKKKSPFEICQEKLTQAKMAKDFEAVLKYFRDKKLGSEEFFNKIKEGLISARKKENPKSFCQRCDAWGETPCPQCAGKGYKEKPCKECDYKGLVVCPKCKRLGKEECSRCKGTGKVTASCPRCRGKGRNICYHCGGDGRDRNVACTRCRGEGYPPCRYCGGKNPLLYCRRCNGSGRVSDPTRRPLRKRTCGPCEGRGALYCRVCTCGQCRGPGRIKVDCKDCVGLGYVSCHRCQGQGKATCPSCRGTNIAKIPCQKCEGKSTIQCPECGGKGIKKTRGRGFS